MRVYIAGPMRGFPGCNFAAFDRVAVRWRAAGHTTILPPDLDRALSYLPDYLNTDGGTNFDHGGDEASLRHAAFSLLVGVTRAEAIALLKGWEKSAGATMELAMAQFLCLPAFDAETMEPYDPPKCPWSLFPGLLLTHNSAGSPIRTPLEGGDWGDCWKKVSADGERRGLPEKGSPYPVPDRSPGGPPGGGSRYTTTEPLSLPTTSPAERQPSSYCSRCGKWFGAHVAQINTVDPANGLRITLCQNCMVGG